MFASLPNHIISTFGGIPNLIQESITDFKVDGGNYWCGLCETVVCCVSDNRSLTQTKFTNHLSDSSHQDKKTKRQEPTYSFEQNVKDICSKTFPPQDIPPIIFVNMPFFTLDANNYWCHLCEKRVLNTSTHNFFVSSSRDNLVPHLLSSEHAVKIEEFYEDCNKVKAALERVFGTTPPPVVDNVEYIVATFGDCNYQCNLCMDKFNVQDNKSVKAFLAHLRSANHKNKGDQRRVVDKCPVLAKIYKTEQIPYYIVNNIEYICCISFIRLSVYCSLCNKLVVSNCPVDVYTMHYKTQQDLKYHFLSHEHEEQFFSKLDPSNKCYRKLHYIFDSFPITVQKDFKYLGMKEENFYCLSCEIEIVIENDDVDTKRNILAHFFADENHITCSIHRENQKSKKFNYEKVEADLIKLYGSIPHEIKKSVEYLSAPSSEEEKYLYCDICEGNKKLQLNEREISKHLSSHPHRSSLDTVKKVDNEIETALLEHFTPDNFQRPPKVEVDPIPNFIRKNLRFVSYEDTSNVFEYEYNNFFPISSSDDENYQRSESKNMEMERVKGNNLFCCICNEYDSKPSVILIRKSPSYKSDSDDLNRKQTEYNLRTHLLSQEHKKNLQKKEEERFQTLKKLEKYFGDIPSYAKNNIYRMVSSSYTGYCTLCSGYNPIVDKSSFEAHFIQRRSCSETNPHQTKEAETEQSNGTAMAELEVRFRQVPRVVLRDIDFLSECGANLFCVLCQEIIFIEGDDLEKIQSDLCVHMRSKKHMFVSNGIRRPYEFS